MSNENDFQHKYKKPLTVCVISAGFNESNEIVKRTNIVINLI